MLILYQVISAKDRFRYCTFWKWSTATQDLHYLKIWKLHILKHVSVFDERKFNCYSEKPRHSSRFCYIPPFSAFYESFESLNVAFSCKTSKLMEFFGFWMFFVAITAPFAVGGGGVVVTSVVFLLLLLLLVLVVLCFWYVFVILQSFL